MAGIASGGGIQVEATANKRGPRRAAGIYGAILASRFWKITTPASGRTGGWSPEPGRIGPPGLHVKERYELAPWEGPGPSS